MDDEQVSMSLLKGTYGGNSTEHKTAGAGLGHTCGNMLCSVCVNHCLEKYVCLCSEDKDIKYI